MMFPVTSTKVATNGVEATPGSAPNRLNASGSIEPIIVPHRQIAVTDRETTRASFHWVISPEDFLLQKLKLGRPQDVEDAFSVLRRCAGRLDLRLLRRHPRAND